MGGDTQTDRHTNTHTDRHINTMTRPGLEAGPSQNGKAVYRTGSTFFVVWEGEDKKLKKKTVIMDTGTHFSCGTSYQKKAKDLCRSHKFACIADCTF